MKADKRMKGLLKELEKFPDLTVTRVERNNHFKLYLDTPSGPQILSASVTCSDHRGMANNRSLFKKWSKKK